jgi:hypothetical protein
MSNIKSLSHKTKMLQPGHEVVIKKAIIWPWQDLLRTDSRRFFIKWHCSLYIFQNTLLSMRDVFQEYKTLILVFVSQYWLFSFNQLLQCIQHSNVYHYLKIFRGPPFSGGRPIVISLSVHPCFRPAVYFGKYTTNNVILWKIYTRLQWFIFHMF